MQRQFRPILLSATAKASAWFKRAVLAPLWRWVDRLEAYAGQKANDLAALFAARWDTCSRCPELNRAVPAMETCRQCGCLMRVKTRIESAKCPLGKW